MYAVKNMDTGRIYYFTARTAYEAMKSMIYYLRLSDRRFNEPQINKTESNRFLYFVYKGDTYCVKID